MSLPRVKISIASGQLGSVTDLGNGVPGLLVHMSTAPTGHAFGTAVKYSQFDDLPDELQAINAIELYFSVAAGYGVYVMPVPDTVAIADMVDYTEETPYAKNLVEAGGGDIRFIGVVGVMLASEVSAAFTNAQALKDYFLTQVNPLRVFLPYSYKVADSIPDLTAMTNDGVGGLVTYQGDEMGLFIGRLASTLVHIHPGKVSDGSMPITTSILEGYADPQLLVEDGISTVELLHDKGWNVLRTHIGKAGYFFTGQPMATTGDYAKLTNCRVIDKAYVIAYGVMLEELNNEVFVTEENTLLPAYVKTIQENVVDAIELQMGNEISGVGCYIDEDQDVITSDELEVVLKIQPVGYSSFINVKLGLTTEL